MIVFDVFNKFGSTMDNDSEFKKSDSADPQKDGGAPPASAVRRLGKAIQDEGVKKIATGTIALVAGILAFIGWQSWDYLTKGGLIKDLGGATIATALPKDAVLIVKSPTCPAGWEAYEEAKGHFILGAGEGKSSRGAPLTFRKHGQSGGSETHDIAVAELPPHQHSGTTGGAEVGQQLRFIVLRIGNREFSANYGSIGRDVGNIERNSQGDWFRDRGPAAKFLDHQHSFTTTESDGLLGTPALDNNMPPWLALTFCQAKPVKTP